MEKSLKNSLKLIGLFLCLRVKTIQRLTLQINVLFITLRPFVTSIMLKDGETYFKNLEA